MQKFASHDFFMKIGVSPIANSRKVFYNYYKNLSFYQQEIEAAPYYDSGKEVSRRLRKV
jgi:hypothetical protein